MKIIYRTCKRSCFDNVVEVLFHGVVRRGCQDTTTHRQQFWPSSQISPATTRIWDSRIVQFKVSILSSDYQRSIAKMIREENWSSFHQKYNSMQFRQSSEFDRHRICDGGIRVLVKKCISRKINKQVYPLQVNSRYSLAKSMTSR